jgi:hypothetical protein
VSLQANTAYNFLVRGARLVFQEKIVLEQRKVGLNPKIGFTKVDKNRDLENGVRVEMNQFDLVVVQKATKEVVGGKTKPVLEEGGEPHNFICVGCRDIFVGGRMPLQHLAVWKEMACDELPDLVFISNEWLKQVWMRGSHGEGRGLRRAQRVWGRNGGGRKE